MRKPYNIISEIDGDIRIVSTFKVDEKETGEAFFEEIAKDRLKEFIDSLSVEEA
jgi:hypothetical protein